MDTSGCHNQLIRWITMKISWQPSRLDDDLWGQWEQSNSWVAKRPLKPFVNGAGQDEAFILHELCYFPT